MMNKEMNCALQIRGAVLPLLSVPNRPGSFPSAVSVAASVFSAAAPVSSPASPYPRRTRAGAAQPPACSHTS